MGKDKVSQRLTGYIDPHNSKKSYKNNNEKQIKLIHPNSQEIIRKCILDIKSGRNVQRARGIPRDYQHLNTIVSRLKTLMEHIYDDCGKTDITKLTAKDIENVCYKMQIGEIKWKTSKGERVYKSTRDYIKIFKDFWHWYMRDQREQNKEIPDITLNLANDTQTESEFVYTTLEDTTKLIDNAKPYYKTQIAFQFDTGIRSPSELMNIRKKDISYISKNGQEFVQVNIRDETSKTFGRKITLTISGKLIKHFIESQELGANDPLFTVTPYRANEYLKRLFKSTFGEKLKGFKGIKPENKELTMYDLRHSSCCYWINKGKSDTWLKYRFGWRKSDMIVYYSKYLGMEDDINEDDLITTIDKHQLEKNLDSQNKEIINLQEDVVSRDRRLQILEAKIDKMQEWMDKLSIDTIDSARKKGKIEHSKLSNIIAGQREKKSVEQ